MGDNIKNNEKDDAEKMRLAFEAFMLTGKNNAQTPSSLSDTTSQPTSQTSKKKKKKKKSSVGSTPPQSSKTTQPMLSTPSKRLDNTDNSVSTQSNTPSSSHKNQSNQRQSIKKRYYQLLRSFAEKVKLIWMDTDDQLLSVMENIVSIRGRLRQEWSLMHSPVMSKKTENEEDQNPQDDNDAWKYCGFQGKPKEDSYSFQLCPSDVQLALSHDLTQHEKMIVGLRSLMSNLADCHDSLGRMVGNIWQFHLDWQNERSEEEGEGEGEENWSREDGILEEIVLDINNVYQMLSMELYRKQCLVPLVIESTRDELLGSDSSNEESKNNNRGGTDNMEDSPLRIARKCSKAWPRSSRESCVDETKLLQVLKMRDTSR